MKRIIAFLCAILITLSLVGCGGSKKDEGYSVDIEYFLKTGQVKEAQFALGTPIKDIEKEILINKKNYQAIFYQMFDIKSDWYKQESKKYVDSLYTSEQIEKMNTDELMDLASKVLSYFFSKKPVWFTISEFSGKYYIAMFYDNEYNRANGEDL